MLEVKNIDVFYGEVQALWDVSFAVKAKEVVTLIGANGAGKTTTLRALSGLVPPRRGQILLDGEPVEGLPPYSLVTKGIALVPEARQLWPGMSVLENLELGAYSKEARSKKDATMKRVFDLFPRLHERQHQKAGTLSGGEQQMCAIGRGLMSLPRLMMLDEPSLGLAPKLVQEVFQVIREISVQGVTVLLVEQNVHHALAVSNRAYVLETGRISLAGEAGALLGDERVKEKFLGV
ncbi:MAG TPA: ABC transporter ATP-binding protein [Symbiobacteriaceae bacterium]|nr:ABC transporter ATP-binding protein [Symbiobacteriaceae bacterium]